MYYEDAEAEVNAWGQETDELWSELARLRAARDAAADGSDLHRRHQDEADQVNYCWLAHRAAALALEGLHAALQRAVAQDTRRQRASLSDQHNRFLMALLAGLPGGVCLLTAYYGSPPWWVTGLGIVLMITCVCLLVAAVGAGRSLGPASEVDDLQRRILDVERACRECWSADGLAEVERLVNPRPSSAVTQVL